MRLPTGWDSPCPVALPGRAALTTGEPFDRQRVCPTHQLLPDAERVNSRRPPFLRPFPRVCPRSGYRSPPRLRPNESARQPSPNRSFAQKGSPRLRQNSPTLSLAAHIRVNGKPPASRSASALGPRRRLRHDFRVPTRVSRSIGRLNLFRLSGTLFAQVLLSKPLRNQIPVGIP